MPKITRKTQKIFCGNADNDQLAVFGSMATGSPVYTNDVEQLQGNTAFGEGWQAATLEDKAPFMEEMNGLQYSSSYQLAYILQQGIAEWDAGTTYYTSSYVVASDGNIYKSNTDNNIGNNPISDSANWFNIALYGANVDLSNLSSIGADKLNTSKMYLTGSISTDEQGYNQLEDMSHSIFDLSKFVVTGSPVITSDGVASGFGANTYISLNEEFDFSQNWKIKFDIETGDVIDAQTILRIGSTTPVNYVVITGRGTISLRLQELSGWSSIETDVANPLKPNSSYTVFVEKNNNVYSIGYIDTNNSIVKNTITNENSLPKSVVSLGTGSGWFFKGSIKLATVSVVIEAIPIFNGSKTGLDVIKPDNYTVVGTPTISEDGVASGFSSNDYINTINTSQLSSSNFNIKLSFVRNILTQNILLSSQYTAEQYGIALIINNNKLMFYLSSNGVDWDVANGVAGKTIINANVEYEVCIEYSDNTYNIYLTNKITGIKTTEVTIQSSSMLYKGTDKIKLGGGKWWSALDGSIDLNSFKIYVDGNLVYQPCLKIPYTESKTGSKIVDVAYRDRVQDVYEQYGQAEYYTIDETNQNFTLPMGEIYGMISSKNISSRVIGELIFSLDPLTDASVHLLDGTLLNVGGIYDNFIKSYIVDLYSKYPQRFCTEAEWQTSVSTYGVCGKYVYTEGVSVRLPKVTGIVEGTLDINALGDIVEAGIPNIAGRYLSELDREQATSVSGAFYVEEQAGAGYGSEGEAGYAGYFDASRSSSVYGNSDTVQPQTTKGFYYIVVANNLKTNVSLEVNKIVTDLNSKADVDLNNCTKPYVVEVSDKSLLPSWYRVYSDGWCEQGGETEIATASTIQTVTLLKPFDNTSYYVNAIYIATGGNGYVQRIANRTLTTFNLAVDVFGVSSNPQTTRLWEAKGYIN